MNKAPILAGHNKLLKIVAEVMDKQNVRFNWIVLSPSNGIMEPALKSQHKKFEQIVEGLQRCHPGLFEVRNYAVK